jgi:hypothetical protein
MVLKMPSKTPPSDVKAKGEASTAAGLDERSKRDSWAEGIPEAVNEKRGVR